MVQLNSSPCREGSPHLQPKSSTPAHKKPNAEHGMRTPVNPPPLRHTLSTLPRPLFRDEPETFSTKKDRRSTGGVVNMKPPPRPPAKSCPPKSRIFKSNELFKAQAVTFLDSPDCRQPTGTPLNPKLFDRNLKESYYQQAFKEISRIGSGYFGTVFKVQSKEDGQMYAIKIANERYRGYSDRDRKLEEVRKHQFLPLHCNLVKFFSSWEEDGKLYQQFELCNGNLQDYAEGQVNIPESLVWGYLVDLLQAVQHLHNHDLVHMDIKPENIFFGVDGSCKLGDFGLIVDLTNQNTDGRREGDSKYLAPEVLKGNISKACDIFSLGITLLEVACDLDLPSKGHLWTELRNRGPDPSLTLQLSPELRRVIQLMISKDPERRPGVNQILELPSVAKAARRRNRDLLLRRLMEQLLAIFHPLILVVTFILHSLESLLSWRPFIKQKPTLTPPADPNKVWANAMDAYSDDEEHDCTVSSAGSDLAAPLQDSSTSSSSDHLASPHSDEKPRTSSSSDPVKRSPLRRPFTSPGPRRSSKATKLLTRTGYRSPQKRLFVEEWDNSPSQEMLSHSTRSGKVSTAGRQTRSSTSEKKSQQLPFPVLGGNLGQEDDMEEEQQMSLQPQSLTFDYFSDDD